MGTLTLVPCLTEMTIVRTVYSELNTFSCVFRNAYCLLSVRNQTLPTHRLLIYVSGLRSPSNFTRFVSSIKHGWHIPFSRSSAQCLCHILTVLTFLIHLKAPSCIAGSKAAFLSCFGLCLFPLSLPVSGAKKQTHFGLVSKRGPCLCLLWWMAALH